MKIRRVDWFFNEVQWGNGEYRKEYKKMGLILK